MNYQQEAVFKLNVVFFIDVMPKFTWYKQKDLCMFMFVEAVCL